MKNLISLLLIISLLFTFVSCSEYNPPVDTVPDVGGEEDNDSGNNNTDQGGTEQRGELFTATVMMNGKPYTPGDVTDDSLALKVRWTDGKTYETVTVGKDGKAECYGLDGEYSVTLINLPDGYTYNPNIYSTSNDNRNFIFR